MLGADRSPRDFLGECLAIDRKRRAGGNAVLVGAAHDQRVQRAHFLVEQADGIVLGIVATEAVRADHFGEAVGLVGGRGVSAAAHLAEAHAKPGLGQLPRGLASGQPPPIIWTSKLMWAVAVLCGPRSALPSGAWRILHQSRYEGRDRSRNSSQALSAGRRIRDQRRDRRFRAICTLLRGVPVAASEDGPRRSRRRWRLRPRPGWRARKLHVYAGDGRCVARSRTYRLQPTSAPAVGPCHRYGLQDPR